MRNQFLQELISHLQPHCTTHKTDPCEQLDLQVNGQSMCYLILDGTVAIYRRSDDMMLSTARSPALFGLANLTDIYFNDYLRTVTPCLIGVLTTDRVAEIIKEKALWGLLSNHLARIRITPLRERWVLSLIYLSAVTLRRQLSSSCISSTSCWRIISYAVGAPFGMTL